MTSETFSIDLASASRQASNLEVLPAYGQVEPVRPVWQKAAIILNANGLSLFEVCESLGKKPKEVSSVLLAPWAREELIRYQQEYDAGEAEQRMLAASAKDAIVVLQTLMLSADKDSVRASAAKEILDRTLGRTTQKINVASTTNFVDDEEEIKALKAKLKFETK